jgi:predicted SAM-dependent methyltransferase
MIHKNIAKKILNGLGYDIYKRNLKIPHELSNDEQRQLLVLLSTIDKVQYGSGEQYLHGWLNIDLKIKNDFLQNPYKLAIDLTSPHPFKNDTFSFGYSEDFIEHLFQYDQILFLTEVYRTFKKGGVLRLSFPGLEGVLNRHYIDNTYKTAEIAKKDAYTNWGHLHLFTVEELTMVCKHLGFSKVEKKLYNQSAYGPLMNRELRLTQSDLNTFIEITK